MEILACYLLPRVGRSCEVVLDVGVVFDGFVAAKLCSVVGSEGFEAGWCLSNQELGLLRHGELAAIGGLTEHH